MVSADYTVGLTDGEGCFYVSVSNSPFYLGGARVGLNFHIKMNEKDKNLLQKIKNTLECGNVYFQKEQRKNHAQCYRYTVGSHRDITEKIVPFFKKHRLQSASKQKSFKAFCEISEIVKAKKHLTKNGIKRIRKLKARMNQKTIGLA